MNKPISEYDAMTTRLAEAYVAAFDAALVAERAGFVDFSAADAARAALLRHVRERCPVGASQTRVSE